MEIRFFQIIVPLISIICIIGLIGSYRKAKVTSSELLMGSFFWMMVLLVAIFPDFFSNTISLIFDIKNNVNAILFLCIGILFFSQYRMYFIIRRQEKSLTQLARQLALEKFSEEEK